MLSGLFSQYPTFLVFLSVFVAAFVTMAAMPAWIRFLKSSHIGQQVRADGPETHLVKQGTPTMGGLIMLLAFPLILMFTEFSGLMVAVSVMNVASFYAYYQFGASYMHSLPTSVLMFILQVPVAFYDGLTTIYALVKRPDFTTFETIKKV